MRLSQPSGIGSNVTALLGPTNTGKTHRAVQRMLEHDSGVIGLPLRLLAREVYDRVAREVGEHAVALVTGEEKRVPHHPSYWVCTVEAMPSELELDFVAVDEIQLIAHPTRGHTFSERLLHARGRQETWFMGSDTVRSLIATLLPAANVRRHPRLSTLSYSGSSTLAALPPRSAVVAFSAQQVYQLAERLRRRFGGVAVVLGALSPRARNAQVALYQSGEVDHLVATDAIGMGLNLDIDHVAFAALRKFDGKEERDINAAELAQIAGRAGRHMNDGSFGTLAPLPELPPPLARAIEEHRFASERFALWRNHDLDFSSCDALVECLKQRPRSGPLRLIESATDFAALSLLLARPEITTAARGPERVELLWEVCQIPDYRNLTVDAHADLIGDIFLHLTRHQRLPASFIEDHMARIDLSEGDLDALLARLGFIRTWKYVAHHAHWVSGAESMQQRSADIEDRLSDAVHDLLVSRFVERGGKTRRTQAARPRQPRVSDEPLDVAPDHPFGALQALRERLRQPAPAASCDEDPRQAALPLGLDERGFVLRGERRVARLLPGPKLSAPRVVLESAANSDGARELEREIQDFVRRTVQRMVGPAAALDPQLDAAGRGLLYQLDQSLGIVLSERASEQLAALSPENRELLERSGFVLGEHALFNRAGLKARLQPARLALIRAHFGQLPKLPDLATMPVSLDLGRGARTQTALRQICLWLGYVVFGARAVRVDVLERLLGELPRGPLDDGQLGRAAQLLGTRREEAARLLHKLGREAPARAAQSLQRGATGRSRRRRRRGSGTPSGPGKVGSPDTPRSNGS